MANKERSWPGVEDILFPKLFQAFHMSIQPSKLIISLAALAVICFAGWIMDFSKTVVVAQTSQTAIRRGENRAELFNDRTELQVYINNRGKVKSFIERYKDNRPGKGVFATLWNFGSGKLNDVLNSLFAFDIPAVVSNIADYFRAIRWAICYHLLYCIFFFLINLAVISIAGGAICRITALQFAQGEKPGLTESLRYSIKKFSSFFTAPLIPLAIIIFAGLFLLVIGLIANLPWFGELILAISMPLVLIAAASIAILLIGAVAGFNLMFPAVAYNGSDCFDAISRSFYYIFSRPWRMLFYILISAVYGAICYLFVRLFTFLLILSGRLFISVAVWVDNPNDVNKLSAIWPEPEFLNLLGTATAAPANWSQSVAAFVIYLALLVVVGLLVSFLISFYFSANTIIYSLMRKKIDGTDFEDVYKEFDNAEPVIAADKSSSEQS